MYQLDTRLLRENLVKLRELLVITGSADLIENVPFCRAALQECFREGMFIGKLIRCFHLPPTVDTSVDKPVCLLFCEANWEVIRQTLRWVPFAIQSDFTLATVQSLLTLGDAATLPRRLIRREAADLPPCGSASEPSLCAAGFYTA